VKPFAELLDRLLSTSGRNAKMILLAAYFRDAPDPDRGIALAVLTGGLDLVRVKPAMPRDLALSRVDPVLFAWSHDFVGDLAETTALIWPGRASNRSWPPLSEVVSTVGAARRADLPDIVASWLDTLDATGRWALLKLLTGGVRVGVSGQLAKAALAAFGGVAPSAIEEVWHALEPPYTALFDWLEGRAARPSLDDRAVFRPLMQANALVETDLDALNPGDYAAEWQWDGIRVQLSARGSERRLYTRAGDDISASFPELIDAMTFEGVLDGELLVVRDGAVAPFDDLRRRLARKTTSARLLRDYPAHVRLYDILFDGAEDLRGFDFTERRRRLEFFLSNRMPHRMDLSPIVDFETLADLTRLRAMCRDRGVEGLMLKRWDSRYVAGRPKGPWFKWKRDPLTVDVVLMYAQRGQGARSTFYSDFTFGAWRGGGQGDELVPVGKAGAGRADDDLGRLDQWIRDHGVKRFGPVREVKPILVVELAFDDVYRSTRHKSGIALLDPRIHRIRWDKPAAEADRLEALERWIV
jgi:DNA ligase-1